ncbi:MAG: hypothetical protein K0M69_15685 [Youngiibacter sp.]|nr:hypothetical protein [Youngiibacter sp.]
MAIALMPITWDIAKGFLTRGTWAKESETGRALRVTLAVNGLVASPSTETLKLRYKASDGQYASTAGTLSTGAYNIELDAAVAGQVGDVQADLELTVDGKTISSPSFSIPVYDSIGI